MENCPICNNEITNKDIYDCGYNTFNRGHIQCKKCLFKLELNCMEREEDYIKSWNKKIKIINEILNKKNEDFIKYLINEIPEKIIEHYESFSKIESISEIIKNDLKLIKENDLNLNINKLGEIEVPTKLLQHGYETLLRKIGLKLKIRSK